MASLSSRVARLSSSRRSGPAGGGCDIRRRRITGRPGAPTRRRWWRRWLRRGPRRSAGVRSRTAPACPTPPPRPPARMSSRTVSSCRPESRHASNAVRSSPIRPALSLEIGHRQGGLLGEHQVVHLPEHPLFAGAKRCLGGFLCVGMDVGQRVVAVDDPQPVAVLALGALQGRLDPGAVGGTRSPRTRRWSPAHPGVRGSRSRRRPRPRETARVDIRPRTARSSTVRSSASALLLGLLPAGTRGSDPLRLRSAYGMRLSVLAVERLDLAAFSIGGTVSWTDARIASTVIPVRPASRFEQALVHELPEERLQHLVLAPVRFDLTARGVRARSPPGRTTATVRSSARCTGLVADGRHHVVVRPRRHGRRRAACATAEPDEAG